MSSLPPTSSSSLPVINVGNLLAVPDPGSGVVFRCDDTALGSLGISEYDRAGVRTLSGKLMHACSRYIFAISTNVCEPKPFLASLCVCMSEAMSL